MTVLELMQKKPWFQLENNHVGESSSSTLLFLFQRRKRLFGFASHVVTTPPDASKTAAFISRMFVNNLSIGQK